MWLIGIGWLALASLHYLFIATFRKKADSMIKGSIIGILITFLLGISLLACVLIFK